MMDLTGHWHPGRAERCFGECHVARGGHWHSGRVERCWCSETDTPATDAWMNVAK